MEWFRGFQFWFLYYRVIYCAKFQVDIFFTIATDLCVCHILCISFLFIIWKLYLSFSLFYFILKITRTVWLRILLPLQIQLSCDYLALKIKYVFITHNHLKKQLKWCHKMSVKKLGLFFSCLWSLTDIKTSLTTFASTLCTNICWIVTLIL